MRLLYDSIVPAVAILIAANYSRLKAFIDRAILRQNLDVRFSTAASRYGDVISLSLILYSIVFWFRTNSVNIFWTLMLTPMQICIRGCGGANQEWFAFPGSRVNLYDVDSAFRLPLPQTVQGILLLYFIWPALFVIGVVLGGLILLRSSQSYYRRVFAIFMAAVLLGLSAESVAALLIWNKIDWPVEVQFLTHGFVWDFLSVGAGLLLGGLIILPPANK
jgi:hypothetical protein